MVLRGIRMILNRLPNMVRGVTSHTAYDKESVPGRHDMCYYRQTNAFWSYEVIRIDTRNYEAVALTRCHNDTLFDLHNNLFFTCEIM